METVKIRLYYDFASTLCYVAHRVLSDIEPQIAELAVELEWRPIDLTMAAPWDRGDSFRPEIRTAVHNTARALGIEVEMPDPWLDSRPAAEVALSAPVPAAEARWRREVFRSIFERRRSELTPELAALAKELVGADALLEGGEDYPRVEESTREALALGVTGVPTFLLDDWVFGGVYDGDTMLALLRQLSERYRELGKSAVN